jgi:hypothetical protein
MPNRRTPEGMGRREFARLSLGTLGAAALAGTAGRAAPNQTPGIKLCVQSPATPPTSSCFSFSSWAPAT